MMCVDVCMDAPRTKAAWFSVPFNHHSNEVFVRADDTRFDRDLSKLNDPSVKFAVLPNTTHDFAVREQFPKAGRVNASDLQGDVDLLMIVITGKADAAINMMYAIDRFNENNPKHQIKAIGEMNHYCHGSFMLPLGDMNFKNMIDTAIMEIASNGRMRNIMLKYMPDDTRYWRGPAKLYDK